MIILDMGAGDATRNDIDYIKGVMDSLPPRVVVKFQLFKKIEGLTPLDPHVFMTAWAFGQKHGIPVTASVFDPESLNILTKITKVPFIKIAARPELYPMIDDVPDFMPVIVSVDSHVQMLAVTTEHFNKSLSFLCCIPDYPAEIEQYERAFTRKMLGIGVSDHTDSTELYRKYWPKLWEKHFDEHGPDQIHSISMPELQEIANLEDA